MIKFVLAILLSSGLFAQSYYTLDNVHSLNLYFSNEAEFLAPDKADIIKQTLKKKLETAGFVFGETDASILVVKIESIEIEGTPAINVQVKLGEDVITNRKGKIETFAYTYAEHKLFEGFDPYEDTLEALSLLVDDFIEAHKDDNEE